MRRHIVLALLMTNCILFNAHAEGNRQQDGVSPAIEHLRNLEYDAAKEQLRRCVDMQPSDLRAWNYLAIATLYQEMFERGVLESSVYGEGGEIFKPSKVPVNSGFQGGLFAILDRAQQLAEERIKADPRDKDAMYWGGVAHGTRATYHFALRKEYLPALHEATAAYNYHSSLLKLDSEYVDAYLVVGVNNYVVGSLPWYFKVFASLTGRHGDREEGLRQVKRVIERGNYAREDAKLMLAILYQREKMYGLALTLYQEMMHSYPRNYLLQFEVSTLSATMNDWRSAAEGYDSILGKHRAGESGFGGIPRPKILYKSGQAYEHVPEDESALDRYSEGGTLLGSDRYIYKSALAAASMYERLHHPDAACPFYKRVADEVPDSEGGKSSRHALRRLEHTCRK
jgi:tetratricopeptide (TPR) repeat protein